MTAFFAFQRPELNSLAWGLPPATEHMRNCLEMEVMKGRNLEEKVGNSNDMKRETGTERDRQTDWRGRG